MQSPVVIVDDVVAALGVSTSDKASVGLNSDRGISLFSFGFGWAYLRHEQLSSMQK